MILFQANQQYTEADYVYAEKVENDEQESGDDKAVGIESSSNVIDTKTSGAI